MKSEGTCTSNSHPLCHTKWVFSDFRKHEELMPILGILLHWYSVISEHMNQAHSECSSSLVTLESEGKNHIHS